MLDRFSLAGKVALVTGGGQGIGRGIALGFAEAGADVVVAARTGADVEAVAGDVRDLGRRALPVVADVMRSEDLDRLVGAA
ncbi:MAG TPA: SDR family NAD(P)-dependent oxidoreductase, partial [Acidimicrobiales bacterium]